MPRQGRGTRRTTYLRGSVPVNISFAPTYFSLGRGTRRKRTNSLSHAALRRASSLKEGASSCRSPPDSTKSPLAPWPLLPASYRRAVPQKMRRNFRNRKIASVPVKGPAFSDPKGTSRPSAEGKVSGEGEARQPLGSRGRGPPRIFAYFLFVKKVWPAAASGRVKIRWNESKCITGKAE